MEAGWGCAAALNPTPAAIEHAHHNPLVIQSLNKHLFSSPPWAIMSKRYSLCPIRERDCRGKRTVSSRQWALQQGSSWHPGHPLPSQLSTGPIIVGSMWASCSVRNNPIKSKITLWCKYYYSHSIGKETEAQRGNLPRYHEWALRLNAICSDDLNHLVDSPFMPQDSFESNTITIPSSQIRHPGTDKLIYLQNSGCRTEAEYLPSIHKALGSILCW